MDIILLSEEKLKIRLTKDDLALYSLTFDSIDYDNTETKLALWSILNKAKHSTGFDAAKDRMFIQVYKRKDGGCNLFVTKLPEKARDTDGTVDYSGTEQSKNAENTSLIPKSASADCISEHTKAREQADVSAQTDVSVRTDTSDRPEAADKNAELIFSFRGICNLLTVCRKLRDMNFPEKSAVFTEKSGNSGNFFLILSGSPGTLKSLRFAFIEEFGEITDIGISYINENCDAVCSENAVGIMSELAAAAPDMRIKVKV